MIAYSASINIMPHALILDPQGKAITGSMKNLQLTGIENIRVGKHITLEVKALSADNARAMVDQACRLLLVNLIMEEYTIEIVPSADLTK